jgi:hypothetical protein
MVYISIFERAKENKKQSQPTTTLPSGYVSVFDRSKVQTQKPTLKFGTAEPVKIDLKSPGLSTEPSKAKSAWQTVADPINKGVRFVSDTMKKTGIPQAIGVVTGTGGAAIGGIVGAGGETIRQTVRAAQGKGFDAGSIWEEAKKIGKETAQFGYGVGEEGAATAPLAAVGRGRGVVAAVGEVANIAMTYGQSYQGVKDIAEGIKTNNPELITSGVSSLALGVWAGKESVTNVPRIKNDIKAISEAKTKKALDAGETITPEKALEIAQESTNEAVGKLTLDEQIQLSDDIKALPKPKEEPPAQMLEDIKQNGKVTLAETKETPTFGQKKITNEAEVTRATGLNEADRAIEDAVWKRTLANEDQLLKEYKDRLPEGEKKVVNADEFRPLFIKEGYAGKNAAAVQEPSSYLAKRAFTEGLKNKGKYATFTSGMSGAGKSSALKGLPEYTKTYKDSAVVLDSNLSSINSAKSKVAEAIAAGKKVRIFYTYRELLDGLVEGVVKRMKNNPKEMGRIVPTSVIAENAPGSWNVAKELKKAGRKVYFVDNSLGQGKAKLSSVAELEKKIDYSGDLKKKLDEKIRELRDLPEGHKDKITQEQYDSYVADTRVAPETPLKKKLKGEPEPTKTEPAKGKSKIAKSIEAKAIEENLTKGFSEIAGYDKITVKDQAKRASDLINENVDDARKIIRGEEPLPDGLNPVALIDGMEQHIKNIEDPALRAELAYELANSPLISETSQAAQTMRLAAERTPDSATAKINELRRFKEEQAKKRGKSVEKAKKQIKEEVEKISIPKEELSWNKFLDTIKC